MATRTTTILTDDIDGSEATSTVKFSIGERQYEIDLNDANADHFNKVFLPWIEAARSAGGGGRPRRSGRPQAQAATPKRTDVAPDPATVRAWAQAHVIEVSKRGRIKASVVKQFVDAQA